ncbi:hypothetical protein [Burkholderia sp. BCC0397]|uniref:hypothetical protein n=1 Tax=Burkholderia sp. BCC0397 TaxID=486876 RepID=UPI001FC7C771|nr:hypothetical protein [Burkholderia sp. BCC0397]
MRYAFCVATDQLLWMLPRLQHKTANEAGSEVDAKRPDLTAQLREFATEVTALATDTTLAHDELIEHFAQLADTTLAQNGLSHASAHAHNC